MLSRKNRLNLRHYFSEVRSNGKKISSFSFSIYYNQNTLQTAPTIGFVISKKVSKKANKRNRMRRVLANSIKPLLTEINSDLQIILFIYKDFSQYKQPYINQELIDALTKGNLIAKRVK